MILLTPTLVFQKVEILSSEVFLGSFRFAILLRHIFGFNEDYDKVCYGFDHTSVLTRSSSDDHALFRKKDAAPPTTNVPDGVVDLMY